MKLMSVLMLAALPLYCYAGVGCQFLQEVLKKTIDSSVPMDEYLNVVEGFVTDDLDKEAVQQFKQCFLDQSSETLTNVQLLMDTIYNSPYCEGF